MTTYEQVAGGSKPGKQIQHTGTCDICGKTNCPDICDAAVHARGRFIWAWSCPDCFGEGNGRLGIGQGQHYRRAT
jgi:hypothetical protein